VDNLPLCFEEVYRVLKKKGSFVFAFPHPFHIIVDSESLKLKSSYFEIGRKVEIFSDKNKKFVQYTHTISQLYNFLVDAGFFIEQILEPDSRKRYPYDPWYGLWDYTPKLLKMVPPTIIFKCIKRG